MKVSCRREGAAWRMDGMRHAQLLGIEWVPRVMPAARMAPINQDTLNRPVTIARSRGYVNSATSCDAPDTAQEIPMPITKREAMNMPTMKGDKLGPTKKGVKGLELTINSR